MKFTAIAILGLAGYAIASPIFNANAANGLSGTIQQYDGNKRAETNGHSDESPGDMKADYRRDEDTGDMKADYRRDEDPGDMKADY